MAKENIDRLAEAQMQRHGATSLHLILTEEGWLADARHWSRETPIASGRGRTAADALTNMRASVTKA
jgi:hypothetical protein